MGRKAEFKAAKSFTLGLSELAWLSEYSLTNNMKASEVVNRLLREAMLNDKSEKIKEAKTHEAYCSNCNDWTPNNLDMICTKCNKLNEQLKRRVENHMQYLKEK